MWDLLPVVAIDGFGAIVASGASKRKAELIALLTQIALKSAACGVILVGFAVR